MTLKTGFWGSVAVMIAAALPILLWLAPAIREGAGGLAPFDTRLAGYGLTEAQAFVAALTPEARALYLGPERWADTVFPLGILGALAFGTLWALQPVRPVIAVVALLPALAFFAFDAAENAVVAAMLRIGEPDLLSAAMVEQASSFTIWKYRTLALALVVLVAAVLLRRRGRGA